jgi:Flp pilus assembly pilin Flp
MAPNFPFLTPRAAPLRGRSGQSLVEYLILVAVIGIATIGIASKMQESLKKQFTNSIRALNGDERAQEPLRTQISNEDFKRRDMADFMRGATIGSRGNDGDAGAGR